MTTKQSTLFSELTRFLDRPDLPDEAKEQLSAIVARLPVDETPPVDPSAFEQVMELNPYAMAILSHEGKWVRGNRAFARLFGSIPPEGYSIFDDPVVKSTGLQDQYLGLKQGKTLQVPELWYDPHDFLPDRPSSPSCISIVMFPLMSQQGELQQIVAMYENITARKVAEENLVRSERMAATGTLAAGVAHEFNNINTRVVGFAEVGLACEPEGSAQREIFERIIAAARRAREITGDLLTHAGARRAGPAPHRLDLLAASAAQMMEHELSSAGVTFERSLEPVPLSALPETEINQVVLNLLINARHAVIDAPARGISLTTGHNDGEVWLEVSDTGCGIPEEELKKIFTPFYSTKGEHADAGSSQAGVPGTGLGLAVCLSIARNLGGDLTVQSVEGEGSTFTLRLPLREAPPAAPQPPDPERAPLAGKRIAVVDDEKDLRFLLRAQLTSEECEVRETDDGAEVLRWVEAGDVDAVVADLIMPRMSGAELMNHISRMAQGDQPAVLVLAGLPSRVTSRDTDGLRSVDVLGKPYQRQELLDALSRLLAR